MEYTSTPMGETFQIKGFPAHSAAKHNKNYE